jgi:outer membrane protein
MPRFSIFALSVLFTWNAVAGESISRPGVLHLNLDQAIQMALAKNFSIEVSRYEPKIARERVTSALGRFDPEFSLRRTFSENTQRDLFLDERHVSRTSILQGESVSTALSGLTPLGTTYDLSLGTRLSSGTANNFDEDFTSEATIALTQPLLRNAGPNANLAQVRIARNNLLVSEWQLRQQVINVITETVFTFNELHLSHENLALALRSRALAEQTQKDNIRRFEIGTMSPLNITTARAEVAAREEAVIVAQRLIKDNENFLKQLVTDDLEPMLSVKVEIDPPPSPAFRADVPAGLAEALRWRPDYRQAVLDLERRNINLLFAKNQALPRLDLNGSLSLLGFDNDAGTSLDRTFRRDQTVWTAGAIFSVPIPNRERGGAENAARFSAAQGLVSLQRLEQQIVVDVDNASGAIVSARERIVSTAEASKLAAESLDAGEQRLGVGTGTTFEVLELQRRLVEAEFTQNRARADYNKAVNEYYRRTGVTLGVYHIEIGLNSAERQATGGLAKALHFRNSNLPKPSSPK